MPSSVHKRTKSQRLADMVLVETWILQGYTEREIVALLAKEGRSYTLSHQQIHYDIGKLQRNFH